MKENEAKEEGEAVSVPPPPLAFPTSPPGVGVGKAEVESDMEGEVEDDAPRESVNPLEVVGRRVPRDERVGRNTVCVPPPNGVVVRVRVNRGVGEDVAPPIQLGVLRDIPLRDTVGFPMEGVG